MSAPKPEMIPESVFWLLAGLSATAAIVVTIVVPRPFSIIALVPAFFAGATFILIQMNRARS